MRKGGIGRVPPWICYLRLKKKEGRRKEGMEGGREGGREGGGDE